METERLQKILARSGYGSRRACEAMIEAGRVAVDGKIAQLGDKADPTTQRITLDGMAIRRPKTHTYVMLYKPRGVITTTSDPEGRRTARELVELPQRLYPVGRLDADSEGLLLLTDDGEVTQHLTHPRYEHVRIYRVLVIGEPDEGTVDRWQRGITLDDKMTRFDKVVIDSQERGRSWLSITVHEGSKHLVRRMVSALGFHVLRLIRVKMGPLQLGDLRPERWRYLSLREVEALRREVGIDQDAEGAQDGRGVRFDHNTRTSRGPRSNRRSSYRSPSRKSSSSQTGPRSGKPSRARKSSR
ncbi:MAG: rRNA pseudouridine synthase [Anaerolineae bacterium]|nr:rRNA pseudouridine synthase [Anaerolineae bacterium]